MKAKKIPMRTSVVSKERFPKSDLLRIVCNKDGDMQIDPSGRINGRGAYIALKVEEAQAAKKQKVFNKAFSTEVTVAFYDELISYVEKEVGRRALQTKIYSADLAPDYD